MKIEISEAFPEHFRPAYPEEFELFSHFETTAGIPSPLFAITTWKENGLPNVCFHAWSCFHGDRTAFFAVMGNLYQHTHTYANILREKCFALNFLPIACYDRLVETIRRNGMDEDEFQAGGFALEVTDDAEVAEVYAVETADGDHRVLDVGIFNSVMNFHARCFDLSGTKVIYTRFITTFVGSNFNETSA